MTDSRLQELKRAWEASGSVEDEAAYLRELVRVGELSEEEFARRSWKQSFEEKLELLRSSIDKEILVRLEDGSELVFGVAEVEGPGPNGPNHRVIGASPLSRWRFMGCLACVLAGLCALLACAVGTLLGGLPSWATLVLLPTIYGAFYAAAAFARPGQPSYFEVEEMPPIKATV